MRDTRRIFDWLVDGAPGASLPAHVVGRLGEELVSAGVPVQRIAAFVRTLHPQFMGRRFVWTVGKAVVVDEAPFATLDSPIYLRSPVAAVFRTGQPLRRRIADPGSPRDFPILDEFAAEGVTDYLVGPLPFLSGEVHAVTFATKAPAGFTDEDVAAQLDLLRPLARVGEIFALRRTAVNFLNTYVGRNAGERILAGKIQRGDIDRIRAVIWCSDLRGFTRLAGVMDPTALIGMLNRLFDCQVPAIERRGGEVLKFIGDGLLAIFPIETGARAAAEQCAAALEAADEAFAQLAALNGERDERGLDPIRFGLALHIGEIAYGNIGGAGRLDFTCIGPAVNLATRLEGLTARLGRPVVLSSDFVRIGTCAASPIGEFELKGVTEPQPVFAPSHGPLAEPW